MTTALVILAVITLICGWRWVIIGGVGTVLVIAAVFAFLGAAVVLYLFGSMILAPL